MHIIGQIHQRSFPIHIGPDILADLPNLVPFLRSAHRIVIVTDREVGSLYLGRLQQVLQSVGLTANVITVDGAETGKNLDTVRFICEELADMSATTSDVLIAFGGGSIIDVAGYVTATFLGQPRLVIIPTTLFAMVDSTICPFSHLNIRSSKNCLGLKNYPTAVVVDPKLIGTLSARQLASGYARILLYGLLENESLVASLESGTWDLATLITLSIEAKQALLNRDPRLLTFGQQISDAIEGHFRFLKYLHGEALGLGLLAVWPEPRLKSLLQSLKLPTDLTGVSPEVITLRVLRTVAPGESLTLVELPELNRPRLIALSGDAAEAALLKMIRSLTPDKEATL
ncbi:MAG: iron-containing alcohol dehydrogenase [Eubacteriales bacterium]|nr:iron-containing alcohol dehydrogenase [Eubacteriales bacterium]